MTQAYATRPADTIEALAAQSERLARPLDTDRDLDPLMARIGNARYVLLGEASHGTSEYYTWRARLSQRLIREKGFSFLAVEGDWPDCYCINRYIKNYPECGKSGFETLKTFSRWPTWMWANREIETLMEWLREFNTDRPPERKVGFYGLDVYSLWDSLDAVMEYLREHDGSALEAAKKAFHCFEPFHDDAQHYAYASALVPELCEKDVLDMLNALRREPPSGNAEDREARFVAEQNALVVKNAEAYYRAMIRGGPSSWNLRDRHMVETLNRLMQWHGPEAKAILWAHNTHVGDARATDMAEEGMTNIGQMVREQHAQDEVCVVGFGSHRGGVIAGYEWGAPMRQMRVPEARAGSWEDVLHRARPADKLLLFSDLTGASRFHGERGHRAIGVVYHPEYERRGNYVPTILPQRYDAFLFLDETEALHPLHIPVEEEAEPPETFPWSV